MSFNVTEIMFYLRLTKQLNKMKLYFDRIKLLDILHSNFMLNYCTTGVRC